MHLYNAALAEGVLKEPWIDMEALIVASTPERVFVGGRPYLPQEYDKRFMLVMGYSATTFSANKRTQKITASSRGPRQMLG